MGKSKVEKKYVIISGFNIHDNNRGTAALGYGALSFLENYGYLSDGQELVTLKFVKKKWWKKPEKEEFQLCNRKVIHYIFKISFFEQILYNLFGITIPFTKLDRVLKQLGLVAAICGGDGFSDIYGKRTFMKRLEEIKIAEKNNTPFIFLPQTIGPFADIEIKNYANSILKKANAVFVRDEKYIDELNRMNIPYTLCKDLSAYMQPQPWEISVPENSIGINVSGLCYSNEFRGLKGNFDEYPDLILQLVKHFQEQKYRIFLIPHSYNYSSPVPNNDDLVACKAVYERLPSKANITLINYDLTSPQLKYLISQLSYFIGTRMHANFAAIYTGVPVFGLAYSYKFQGAFDANGLNGKEQTHMINNICKSQIQVIIKKIDNQFGILNGKES